MNNGTGLENARIYGKGGSGKRFDERESREKSLEL